MKLCFSHLLCIILLLAGTVCGQTITFRVITTGGKPLDKRNVSFSLDGIEKGQPVGRGQTLETDRNGEVKFDLPASNRDAFFFYVDLGSVYWHCACIGIAKTQDVLEKGTQQSVANEYSAKTFAPTPGVVLVIARKYSWWERLLSPLVKD
jgi:hypothetical protein